MTALVLPPEALFEPPDGLIGGVEPIICYATRGEEIGIFLLLLDLSLLSTRLLGLRCCIGASTLGPNMCP